MPEAAAGVVTIRVMITKDLKQRLLEQEYETQTNPQRPGTPGQDETPKGTKQ